jgi:hypothetical protein
MLVETGGERLPICKLREYREGVSPETLDHTNLTGGMNKGSIGQEGGASESITICWSS